MFKRCLRLATVLFALDSAFNVAGAQGIDIGTGGVNGLVRDSAGVPIGGALVAVAGTTLTVETDEQGQFRLAKVSPGELSLRIKRLGFMPDTVRVAILAGQTASVNIVLTRAPVALSSVVVTGRREATGQLAGFYRRMSQGVGRFLTREQIEHRNASSMTDLLRGTAGLNFGSGGLGQRSGVRFRGASPSCAPLTYIDGIAATAGEFDLNAIDPMSLAGVELYSGPSTVPAEFSRSGRFTGSTCGTIVLWTRMAERRPKKPKPSIRSAASLINDLVSQQSVFTANEVDVPAHPDSSDIVHPIYPDSLYENLIGGRTTIEVVISAVGEVLMETFNVVSTTHPRFVDAVRLAVEDQKFIPARRRGLAVPQVVQLPFVFVPDSSVKRRR